MDNEGNIIENSIAEFSRVKINGDTHAILIRSKNISNPVLLFLHAGPCLSETGLMRNLNPELEEHFTMVYYDMRGSAKSYKLFQNYKKTYTTKNLLQDIHEITLHLKNKLKKNKIGIMGHSFGAGFGALAVSTYPNDYSIHIGLGQPSNILRQNKETYDWVINSAKSDNNLSAVKSLNKAYGYWDITDKKEFFSKMMIHKKWVGHYGGQIVGKTDFIPFMMDNLLCDEYTIFDFIPYFLGMLAGGPASFEMMTKTDLKKQANIFKAPIVFITGRQDYNLGPAVLEDYFNSIEAPYKKMYWFDDSAHFPHVEEIDLFQTIMIKEILPIIKNS